ncbi:MAG: hypothetical protein QXK21_02390 [Candidatus Micrarchaeia archaeon]
MNPTKTSVNAIIKKIEEIGYEAKEVSNPNVKNTKKNRMTSLAIYSEENR